MALTICLPRMTIGTKGIKERGAYKAMQEKKKGQWHVTRFQSLKNPGRVGSSNNTATLVLPVDNKENLRF